MEEVARLIADGVEPREAWIASGQTPTGYWPGLLDTLAHWGMLPPMVVEVVEVPDDEPATPADDGAEHSVEIPRQRRRGRPSGKRS